MSARTGLRGGYRATGIPTAITRLATERASAVTLHLQLARAGSIPTKENAGQPHTHPTRSGKRVSQGLSGVRKAAKENKEMKFTALLHHLTVDLLRESFYSLKRKAAPGVDGVTWQEYEDGLEDRLTDLHGRVHRGAYRATPSRRVYIEKADGRQRPLAVPAIEDKLVQQAVVTILNQIYEEDFLGFCVLQGYTDKEVMMT
jgi:RNA-directed DNA polymerase